MALTPSRSGRFKKDDKLMKRRGKVVSKILHVMKTLADEEPLEPRHRDHNLVGNYVGCRECHVEPDWLLIYSIGDDWIRFERTGTHSDLFE
ncbi:type II toxin-antitoxin system YafQ family toxin [Candidatus Deferrimicrobium sp.]|uniref:type II toxin-antitoxin system YafQ family toxin n=1 Tax=Candidatus Deferrimicrobium sp. TaxID=3060586 RepID=UPI003C69CD02